MDRIIGTSEWSDEVRAKIARISRFTSSALITGPSGTGKELIARSIHEQSPRAGRPFIPVDCAAIPGTLFSSQLFGHVKGAFTGASGDALGCFRAAEGGTIFLDEVGELEFELQAKLLRVIQERQVTPIGSHRPIPIDVRIVAATNRNLDQEVAASRFRLDLFYRLDVLSIASDPLKDRPEDIEPLARYFVETTCREFEIPAKRLTPAAIRMMQAYDWPGNVRQLQNIVERAIVMSETLEIGPEFIPRIDDTAVPDPTLVSEPGSSTPSGWRTMADNERDHIRRTLEFTGYNQSAAARLLEIDYRLLMRRIKKFGLKPTASSQSEKSAAATTK
ncbi:MAG: sigma-54 dependent transcriptional regulator [Planctomycetota bacterium]|nr:sigma-54 dependent transcriptional regulator [Planctomycetota bacterium]